MPSLKPEWALGSSSVWHWKLPLSPSEVTSFVLLPDLSTVASRGSRTCLLCPPFLKALCVGGASAAVRRSLYTLHTLRLRRGRSWNGCGSWAPSLIGQSRCSLASLMKMVGKRHICKPRRSSDGRKRGRSPGFSSLGKKSLQLSKHVLT